MISYICHFHAFLRVIPAVSIIRTDRAWMMKFATPRAPRFFIQIGRVMLPARVVAHFSRNLISPRVTAGWLSW